MFLFLILFASRPFVQVPSNLQLNDSGAPGGLELGIDNSWFAPEIAAEFGPAGAQALPSWRMDANLRVVDTLRVHAAINGTPFGFFPPGVSAGISWFHAFGRFGVGPSLYVQHQFEGLDEESVSAADLSLALSLRVSDWWAFGVAPYAAAYQTALLGHNASAIQAGAVVTATYFIKAGGDAPEAHVQLFAGPGWGWLTHPTVYQDGAFSVPPSIGVRVGL